eukprot:m.265259 g.265259  ORF g.265259 m.265259 type:complete len:985 (+) comp60945_c0_seq1:182-3136(+)
MIANKRTIRATPNRSTTPSRLNKSQSTGGETSTAKENVSRSIASEFKTPSKKTGSTASKSAKVQAREAALTAMGGVKIDVYVRVRPHNAQETTHNDVNIVKVAEDHKSLVFTASNGRENEFAFDRVFDPSATQLDVFEKAVAPIVDQVAAGLSCAIFAYGQTGAGKTHTMRGNLKNDAEHGVIQRSTSALLTKLQAANHTNLTTAVSFLEIYNEGLEDLFLDVAANEVKPKLTLIDDKKHGCVCHGLTHVPFSDDTAVMKLLALGEKRAKVSATKMNKVSNRAHRIFIITVKYMVSDGTEETATLTFVDLAGSEDIGRSGAKGETAKEACHINKSLLSLGRVIDALASNEKHIPYRDSKLTQFLSEALGGMCKTTFISCVSPASTSARESDKTLRYAARAMEALNISQLPRWKQDQIMIDGLTRRVEALLAQIEKQTEAHKAETQELKVENKRLLENQTNILNLLPQLPQMIATAITNNVARQSQACDEMTEEITSSMSHIGTEIKSHNEVCRTDFDDLNTKILKWNEQTTKDLSSIGDVNTTHVQHMSSHNNGVNEVTTLLHDKIDLSNMVATTLQSDFVTDYANAAAAAKQLLTERTKTMSSSIDSCHAQAKGSLSTLTNSLTSQEKHHARVVQNIKKIRDSKLQDFNVRVEGITCDIRNADTETAAFVEQRLKRDTERPPAKIAYKYPKSFPKTANYETLVGSEHVQRWRQEVAIAGGTLTAGLGADFSGGKGSEDCSDPFASTADEPPQPVEKDILDVAYHQSDDEDYDTDQEDEAIAATLFPDGSDDDMDTEEEEEGARHFYSALTDQQESEGGDRRDPRKSALAVMDAHPYVHVPKRNSATNLVRKSSNPKLTRKRSATKITQKMASENKWTKLVSKRSSTKSTEQPAEHTGRAEVVEMKRISGFPLGAVGRRVKTNKGHTAVIRFLGTHAEGKGPRVGIEYLTPVGNMNGNENGFKYFSCKPKHGSLLTPDQVRLQA